MSALHLIINGNRTAWSPIRSVIILVINKFGRPSSGSSICLITSMIADRIGRHEVLLPINHNQNFRENKCIPFSLSNVTNLSILENPQFGRVSGCCYGYCDKFCDWCIKLSALNMIG